MHKQQQIDRLQEENNRLKARLLYQERTAKEAPFGSSTPSSKQAIKLNSLEDNQKKIGGAKVGHVGSGRCDPAPEDFTRTERVDGLQQCPDCGVDLVSKGFQKRTVIDVVPVRKEVIAYQLHSCACPKCRRVFTPPAPGVFSRNLYSNRLLAHLAHEHYVHGITLGYLTKQLNLNHGTVIQAMHALAIRLESILKKLQQQYRQAKVRHADETGWRNDGKNGYAWLFCTPTLSLFRFPQTRSGKVPLEMFGSKPRKGVLVVDRYKAYNRVLCQKQYCYAHLLREVKDLTKEFPELTEVQQFVDRFAPLLSDAMKLRTVGLKIKEFQRQALQLKTRIQQIVESVAQHPGIQRIQNIFRENAENLYHWITHPDIPAENNRAERELRPLVIARKLSFGSQSERGLKTREILMSVLNTLNKRTEDGFSKLTSALNALASDPKGDPYNLLFNSS